MSHIHHYSVIQNSFTALKKKKNPLSFSCPPLLIPPELLAATDLFTVSTLCLFWNVI